jgi:hypothetical protein
MPCSRSGNTARSARLGSADHAATKVSCRTSQLVEVIHQGQCRAEGQVLELPRQVGEPVARNPCSRSLTSIECQESAAAVKAGHPCPSSASPADAIAEVAASAWRWRPSQHDPGSLSRNAWSSRLGSNLRHGSANLATKAAIPEGNIGLTSAGLLGVPPRMPAISRTGSGRITAR